jgi:quercetin dioxygenase-like cupin family protein
MPEQPASTPRAVEPVSVPADAGEAWWWAGSLAVIKATAADTGGRVTIVEITEPAGAEAPLHVHHAEDEGFWVLEGEVTFEVGGTKIPAGPGDYALGPRDIPHRYFVGERGCRMLFIFTPGGFEELIREMGEPAVARTLPPTDGAGEEPDWERVEAIARKHCAELLG